MKPFETQNTSTGIASIIVILGFLYNFSDIYIRFFAIFIWAVACFTFTKKISKARILIAMICALPLFMSVLINSSNIRPSISGPQVEGLLHLIIPFIYAISQKEIITH